ncbi:MAG TPA: F0F1 ATP synthase subunit epsilon [Bacteroidales bacterium]|jgi:F-type H+-transporting ATPase subunit epsilon|nr:F0F1 ATP synthase subunit epsilon [Bacteroidales bacterium]HRS19625.1 F0F1 ATP synthase subunit epsilon [Bacteroidales bacterium]
MEIEIITPSTQLYNGKASQVNVPGSNGSFEILENHAPIISTLQKGTIILIDQTGTKHSFDIPGGVVEQSKNKVLILVD